MRSKVLIKSLVVLITLFVISNNILAQTDSTSIKFMLVFLSPNENTGLSNAEKQIIENDHLRNIGRLSESGILANAWPIEGGSEVMVLNTSTLAQTEAVLMNDPAIVENLFLVEILGWEIRYGGICEPDFPYEMSTYTMIRYLPTNQIASYKTSVDFDMRSKHQEYIYSLIESNDVIVEGYLGTNDGGILIYKGTALNSLIEQDPSIKDGYLMAQKYTIWLNKGSFCIN